MSCDACAYLLLCSCPQLGVTALTEQRMLERPGRADAYGRYVQATSMWLPLPPWEGDKDD